MYSLTKHYTLSLFLCVMLQAVNLLRHGKVYHTRGHVTCALFRLQNCKSFGTEVAKSLKRTSWAKKEKASCESEW